MEQAISSIEDLSCLKATPVRSEGQGGSSAGARDLVDELLLGVYALGDLSGSHALLP